MQASLRGNRRGGTPQDTGAFLCRNPNRHDVAGRFSAHHLPAFSPCWATLRFIRPRRDMRSKWRACSCRTARVRWSESSDQLYLDEELEPQSATISANCSCSGLVLDIIWPSAWSSSSESDRDGGALPGGLVTGSRRLDNDMQEEIK